MVDKVQWEFGGEEGQEPLGGMGEGVFEKGWGEKNGEKLGKK